MNTIYFNNIGFSLFVPNRLCFEASEIPSVAPENPEQERRKRLFALMDEENREFLERLKNGKEPDPYEVHRASMKRRGDKRAEEWLKANGLLH